MIGQRAAEKLANLLFGNYVANLIGSHGQTVLNLKNQFDKFCGACSKHYLCKISKGLDNMCDRRGVLNDFENLQHGGQILMFP